MRGDAVRTDGTAKKMPVNGTVLDCLVAGEGPPLVAVHGALSDLRAWERLTPQLISSNKVIAYTQRHFGSSAWQDAEPNISCEEHVKDLLALIEALETAPVNVLGWSYGGDVAVRAILERPDLFGKAVLFDPSYGVALAHIDGAETAKAEFHEALAPSLSLLDTHKDTQAAISFAAGVTGRSRSAVATLEPGVAQILKENARTLRPFMAAMLKEKQSPCSPAAFAKLDVPALIVTGSRSLSRYRLIADWLAEVWPQSQLVQLEGATHFGPLEKSAEFGLEIRRFLYEETRREL